MDTIYVVDGRQKHPYGCFMLLLDIIMLGLTSGLWLIWIIIRQWRNR